MAGLVGPGQFMPIAEKLGLMAGIGSWVVEQVVQQARRWRVRRSNWSTVRTARARPTAS